MKKMLLTLAMSIIVALSYSQDSMLVKIPDTAKLIVTKVYNDVKAGLQGLAGGLKVGVSHVYEVLVKQQAIYSVSYLIILTTIFLFTIFFWRKFFKIYNRFAIKDDALYNDDLDDHFITSGGLAIAIILTIVFLIVLGCLASNIITGLFNPEYGAIKDIIDFVK